MRMPEWMVPMAATLTQERFTGPDWLFEQKLDGIRLLAFRRGADVRLYSRNRLAREVPAVARAIAALPLREAILDGELEWSEGAYHVFDVLWLDGRDRCALPLEERREILRRLPLEPPLRRVEEVAHAAPWELARERGWEGVIAKRRGTPYEHRRSKHWLKMKVEVAQPFVVGGFTDPQGARVGLGALLIGTRDGDDLVFAGKVGAGLDTAGLLALRARLDALEVAAPPFTRGTGIPRVRVHWVRPEVVVDVGFTEWTAHGKLRHPRLLEVHP
jgi:bifunctional non-homologous end joining protein LigD